MSFLLLKTPGNLLEKVPDVAHDRPNTEKIIPDAKPSNGTHPSSSMVRKEQESSCMNEGIYGGNGLNQAYYNGQKDWEDSNIEDLACKFVSQICFLPDGTEETVQNIGFEDVNALQIESAKNCNSSQEVQSDTISLAALNCNSEEEEVVPNALSFGANQFYDEKENGCPEKLKSVLRGGNEKLGLGPRPKLHVTWAPEVYDPPCTSASHTTTRSYRRHSHSRNDHKSHKGRSTSHKGKASSNTDSHKKSHRRTGRRTRQMSETYILSTTSIATQELKHSNSDLVLGVSVAAGSLDGSALKGALSSFLLPQKGYQPLSQILPFSEKEQHIWHMQKHKLYS